MKRYHQIIRALFALVFIAGGIAHFVLGRLQPRSFAGFADTAVFPWLRPLKLSSKQICNETNFDRLTGASA